MRLRSEIQSPRGVPYSLVYGALGILCAAAATLLAKIPERLLPIPLRCPFRALTGLPCLTCGGTRAMAALARGDLQAALSFNPLVSLTALALVAFACASSWQRLTRRSVLRIDLTPRERSGLRGLAAAALAINWVYLLVQR